MTKENLEKANELLETIKKFKSHRNRVKTDKENPYISQDSRMKSEIYVENIYNEVEISLWEDFLPISIQDYVNLYLGKLDKEIERLEKEFENL